MDTNKVAVKVRVNIGASLSVFGSNERVVLPKHKRFVVWRNNSRRDDGATKKAPQWAPFSILLCCGLGQRAVDAFAGVHEAFYSVHGGVEHFLLFFVELDVHNLLNTTGADHGWHANIHVFHA